MGLTPDYFEKLHAQACRTETFLRLGMPSAKQLQKELRDEVRGRILEPLNKGEDRLGREFCKRILTEYDPSEKRFLEYCAREALVKRVQKWLRKLEALSNANSMAEEAKGHNLSFARAVWKISSAITCDEIQVRRIVSHPRAFAAGLPKRAPLKLVHSK